MSTVTDELNLTRCPDCKSELVTEDAERDMPVESLLQTCECGNKVAVSILHYPDGSYVVLGPPIDSDECIVCGNGAVYRMNDIRDQITEAYCMSHGTDILESIQDSAAQKWETAD